MCNEKPIFYVEELILLGHSNLKLVISSPPFHSRLGVNNTKGFYILEILPNTVLLIV